MQRPHAPLWATCTEKHSWMHRRLDTESKTTRICTRATNEWHTLTIQYKSHVLKLLNLTVHRCSHLNSCTFSCRVITQLLQLMSEKEEVLITGGKKEETSSKGIKQIYKSWARSCDSLFIRPKLGSFHHHNTSNPQKRKHKAMNHFTQ